MVKVLAVMEVKASILVPAIMVVVLLLILGREVVQLALALLLEALVALVVLVICIYYTGINNEQ